MLYGYLLEHGQNLSVATLLGEITDSLAAPQKPLSVNSSLGRMETSELP